MTVFENLMLTVACFMALFIWHTLVYQGFPLVTSAPATGRLADVLRFVLKPLHLLLVWNPYPPIAVSRISSIMHFASRNPRRALRLVTHRNDVKSIVAVLNTWQAFWPLDAEFSVLLFRWLVEHPEPAEEGSINPRSQPCMRLVHALTEQEALATLVPELVALAADPSSNVSDFDVEYAIATSRAFCPEVLRQVPGRMMRSVLFYSRPSYHGRDPLAEIFPNEQAPELTTAVNRVSACFPETLFGDTEILIRQIATDQPGWSLLMNHCLNTNPQALTAAEIIQACAPIKEHAPKVAAIAGLMRAGAPGGIPELGLLVDSLELS